MSRLLSFLLGVVVTLLVVVAGAYLFVRLGGLSMATSAPPLPFERFVATTALEASFGGAEDVKSPLPADEANLSAGAGVYKEHCGMCHGLPGGSAPAIARGMFPRPPQLFQRTVTDDPVGETYWKVTNGIRLSGMPGFDKTLPEKSRWQVALMLANADKLPPTVRAALK